MEFGAEMQHHIQAIKLFKCPFLIKMFCELFAKLLTVLFLNYSFVMFLIFHVILKITKPLCVLHKLEIIIS